MARGYPDYFGQSIFQKLGSPLESNVTTGVFGTGLSRTVCDLTLKGRIYGGFIRVLPRGVLTNIYLSLEIDGESIDPVSFASLLEMNIFRPEVWFCYLNCYNTTGPLLTAAFSPGITFETNYKVVLTNSSLSDISALTRIYYSRVI